MMPLIEPGRDMMESQNQQADLIIVGAGAAGLTAAIFAGETARSDDLTSPARIVVLDGARVIGAKILVSGGGRCNVTNVAVAPADFNGSRNIVKNVLAAFDESAAVKWFASLGVDLKREPTGKLFPISDSARSVLDALLQRCADLKIEIQTERRVTDLLPPRDDPDGDNERLFTIVHERGAIRARRVIFSTGGRSLPRSGSDGGGWEILKRLGHTITETYPALVPLVLTPQMFHKEVSGIAQDVELSVFADGKRIDHRAGSLLWTHFGISGPVVMDASRHWVIARDNGPRVELKCNLLPGESFESIEKWLVDVAAARPRASVANVIAERIPSRVAEVLVRHVHIATSGTSSGVSDGASSVTSTASIGQLRRETRRALVHALTALVLPVEGPRGWNYAEVTAGGVPLSEIDFRTMQSRKIPGLFLAGEVLDCDGRIGGFNFQWAWSTGYLAGRAAMK